MRAAAGKIVSRLFCCSWGRKGSKIWGCTLQPPPPPRSSPQICFVLSKAPAPLPILLLPSQSPNGIPSPLLKPGEMQVKQTQCEDHNYLLYVLFLTYWLWFFIIFSTKSELSWLSFYQSLNPDLGSAARWINEFSAYTRRFSKLNLILDSDLGRDLWAVAGRAVQEWVEIEDASCSKQWSCNNEDKGTLQHFVKNLSLFWMKYSTYQLGKWIHSSLCLFQLGWCCVCVMQYLFLKPCWRVETKIKHSTKSLQWSFRAFSASLQLNNHPNLK